MINIPNSFCIDSRKGKDQHEGFRNNANNFIALNVVDGHVRFQGYGSEERHCVKGANFVVRGEMVLENKCEDLEKEQPDIVIEKPNLKTIRSKYIRNFKIRN